MSNIDQAFINAYADQSVATAAPPRGNYAVREPGPALRVFSQSTDREPGEQRIDRPHRGSPALHASHPTVSTPTTYADIAARQLAEFADHDELTLPSLVGERKPLSAFSGPKQLPTAAFKPVYEVDGFCWPEITDDLIASRKPFVPILDLLLAIAREGRTLIGISSTDTGVGASTVAMCLARLLTQSGRNVALVDSNFTKGNLARSLGLEFEQGWEDVLVGNIPLAECAVASLADKMTLIPLRGPAEAVIGRLSSIQSSVIAGMLRYHHELVLFDLGAASDSTQLAATRGIVEHCRIDAGIIVATVGARDPVSIHGIDQLSAAFGPACLGVIGNRAKYPQ